MTRTESLKNKFMKILPDVVEIDKATLEDCVQLVFKEFELMIEEISEKEINKQSNRYCYNEARFTFIQGVKWLKEKLKNKYNENSNARID